MFWLQSKKQMSRRLAKPPYKIFLLSFVCKKLKKVQTSRHSLVSNITIFNKGNFLEFSNQIQSLFG